MNSYRRIPGQFLLFLLFSGLMLAAFASQRPQQESRDPELLCQQLVGTFRMADAALASTGQVRTSLQLSIGNTSTWLRFSAPGSAEVAAMDITRAVQAHWPEVDEAILFGSTIAAGTLESGDLSPHGTEN